MRMSWLKSIKTLNSGLRAAYITLYRVSIECTTSITLTDLVWKIVSSRFDFIQSSCNDLGQIMLHDTASMSAKPSDVSKKFRNTDLDSNFDYEAV